MNNILAKTTLMQHYLKGLVFLIIVISSGMTRVTTYATENDSLIQVLDTARSDTLRASLYHKLASNLYSSHPDSAKGYAEKGLAIARKHGYSKLEGKLLNSMGNIYDEKGEFLKSLNYNKKALSIFRSDSLSEPIGLTYNNIGINYYKLGDFPKAIHMLQKSLKIRQLLEDTAQIAKTLNNIGMVHTERNKYDRALEVYKRALQLKKGYADAYSMAAGYNNIANVYNRKDDYDKALKTFRRALAIYDSLDSQYGRGAVLNNIGLVHELKGEQTKAEEYYKQAHKIYQELNYKPGLTIALNNVANILASKEEYRKALPYARKSYKFAEEMGSKNDLKNAAEMLSTIYENLDAYKKALEYHQIFKQYSDSLLSESNVKKITELEMQYEFDKKRQRLKLERQKEEALHREAMKRQRLIQYGLIAGLLALVVLAFLIYKNYRVKVKANRKLMEKNAQISQQKEEIQTQAEHLAEANEEITRQKESIEYKNKQITKSIEYAKRIQTALLRGKELLAQNLNDHFILWKPRDIVSGDFYWIRKIGKHLLVVAADSTGHGVPGAFMSMLGIAFLNEITRQENIEQPSETLEQLRLQVKDALTQQEQAEKRVEGMDMGFCSINMETLEVQFAGAYNPLYLIRNKKLHIYKATRNPIGTHMRERSFENNRIQMQPGDRFYMFSDGITDQIGGEKGIKYNASRLRSLLLNSADESMATQKLKLEKSLSEWMKGKYKQIDDMLILGGQI